MCSNACPYVRTRNLFMTHHRQHWHQPKCQGSMGWRSIAGRSRPVRSGVRSIDLTAHTKTGEFIINVNDRARSRTTSQQPKRAHITQQIIACAHLALGPFECINEWINQFGLSVIIRVCAFANRITRIMFMTQTHWQEHIVLANTATHNRHARKHEHCSHLTTKSDTE